MIEKIILDYLKQELLVPVFMEVPESAPDKFCLLQKTSSSRLNRLYSSSFSVQSYADSQYNAALLNEQVKSAMDNLISINDIGASKFNTDYVYNDVTRKRYRYQCIYDIYHY